jgi:alpha-galactosidase
MKRALLLGLSALLFGATSQDISGTWVGKINGPFGQMEVVYELKVDAQGAIHGVQKMDFGDWPIVDGKLQGEEFELTVEAESFGEMQKRTTKGKILGDALEILPVMPAPRKRPTGDAGGPGGPGGPRPRFNLTPVTFHRGTPTPSYRAPSVDYKTLAKVALPELREVPANGLAKTPPMGWNSWNKFKTAISDKTVREIADAMVSSGMRDAGYLYINIDDGWQWKRDDKGVLLPNPNFPDMKALADYVHSKGLKIGIYSSPGPQTCARYVGSYGYEDLDAKTWAAWGMDYLKYDWCSASRVWNEDAMQAAYQKMGEALRAAGRPIVYSLCQYGRAKVQEWGPKVGGNSWRTTGDIRDQWQSMERIGFSQSELAAYAAPGHWNDPDMLEIGNGGMSEEEYKTHMTLWSMLAAPLIAGNDLRSMTPAIKEILLNKDVIAVDQDKLGRAATRAAQQGTTEVWSRPLDGSSFAVALFNRGDATAKVEADWKALGIGANPKVRDLWKHQDLGRVAGTFSAEVAPHGVVLVRVTP